MQTLLAAMLSVCPAEGQLSDPSVSPEDALFIVRERASLPLRALCVHTRAQANQRANETQI